STPRLTPLRARDATDEYATYFRAVCGLTVEASCDAKGPDSRIQMHLFGRAAGTQHTYWCTFDSDDTTGHGQSLWEPVSFPEPVNEIVGAVLCAISTGRRCIFLFARTEGRARQDLFVAKYDLDSGRWCEDPISLDVMLAE